MAGDGLQSSFVLTLFLHDRNYESRWFIPFGSSIGRVNGEKAPRKPGKGTCTEDKTVLCITLV